MNAKLTRPTLEIY